MCRHAVIICCARCRHVIEVQHPIVCRRCGRILCEECAVSDGHRGRVCRVCYNAIVVEEFYATREVKRD